MHKLLLYLIGSLVFCVSLAQASPRVVLLSTEFSLSGKYQTLIAETQARGLSVRQHYIEKLSDQQLVELVDNADLILADGARPPDAEALLAALETLPGDLPPWVLMHSQGPDAAGMSMTQARRIQDYFRNGGQENFRHLAAWLVALLGEGDMGSVPAPHIFPESGYYHPDLPSLVTDDLATFRQTTAYGSGGGPRIGILVHRSVIGNGFTAPLDDLMRRIDLLGGQAVGVFAPIRAEGALNRLLGQGEGAAVDVLINFQALYLAERDAEHRELDVPVLQAINWRSGNPRHWRDDPVGIPTGSVPFYLALPEGAGVTDPLVVAAVEAGMPVPIPEQMASLAQKAVNMARLRYLANAEKKVAVMFWNYPSGENNLSASFLNVPRSLAEFSRRLQTAGYATRAMTESALIGQLTRLLRPFYRSGELTSLLADDLAGILPLARYQQWFSQLPKSLRTAVTDRWGDAQDSPMLIQRDGEHGFVVPRLQAGNLLIMPQPPRGQLGEDPEKGLYHDSQVPLNHFYLAAYLYVREQFAAHAIVHFGTHGTQEWTPGKERGLSVREYPYVVLGDTPVFYPYIVDNIGEATQAKRRGRATIVSHQTPPFSPAGLYHELLPLHDLVHEYQLLDTGEVRRQTAKRLLDAVAEDGLHRDIGWERDAAAADFDAFLLDLHDHLHALAQTAQPLGLHTLGRAPDESHRITTVMQMLGEPFYAALALDNADELFVADHERIHETLPYRLLRAHLLGEGEKPLVPDSPVLTELLAAAETHYANLAASAETAGLLRLLDGRYLPPSGGGDPIRHPDSLPTGHNLYGFDPSKLPTKSAWQTGSAAVDELIASHREQQGDWPRKLAFSLWSVEAMRHLGVLEAQVFHAMGVAPVWDAAGRVSGFDIIPREQLQRPRVDVVMSATGLYRDHFPNVMQHLTAAAAAVAELDEPDNFVRQNALALNEELRARGFSDDEAWALAVTRLFSSETGSYGTGLEDATLASDTWEDDGKLAELYLNRMQYAYGPDPDTWGRRLPNLNLYARQLDGVEAAVFSRTSNLYGMLTTDDPFQYLGGISLAVRHLTGSSPSLYISNLRNPGKAFYQSTARFLAEELRTRQFHPGWIGAMQQEGYSGTLEILDSMNNFWGWQVVDPETVRPDQWQAFFDIYVEDSYDMDMRAWFEQHNPHALAQIVERMLEAARKDYWEASDEVLATLAETWQALDETHDVQAASSMLEDYIATLDAGFGLGGAAPEAAAGAAARTVQGQQLQPVVPPETLSSISQVWLLVLGLLMVWGAGMLVYANGQRRLG